MPIHMADLGSDNWEQEFTLGLLENEEALVREIDEALARIETRTYGMCLATHKRISKARLRAKPWAKFCIEYARAREEGRVS
jgi:RNA polymerase-binding transcription factor DksA